jgi:DNA-binding CsgD family transcriptional regulator
MKNGLGRIDEAGRKARLPEGLVTFAAYEAALDMIPQPTFVISGGGPILQANALGEQLVRRDPVGVRRSLVQAARGEPQDRPWRLTALRGSPPPAGFIVVLDPSSPRAGAAGGQPTSVSRWKLTARQAEVLDEVARGATNAAVAETLGIKERTVEFHLSAIFDKPASTTARP